MTGPDLPARVDRLEITTSITEGTLEASLRGDLDIYTAAKFDRHVRRDLDGADLLVVVLDLRDVTTLDSTAIQALWSIRHDLQVSGRHLVLRSPSPVVHRTLSLVGLLSSFDVE